MSNINVNNIYLQVLANRHTRNVFFSSFLAHWHRVCFVGLEAKWTFPERWMIRERPMPAKVGFLGFFSIHFELKLLVWVEDQRSHRESMGYNEHPKNPTQTNQEAIPELREPNHIVPF